MRTRYKLSETEGLYFVTSTIVGWIPVFTGKEFFDIIIDSLNYCRSHKGLRVYSFVILDNHIHLVVSGPHLSQTIKEFKSYTAREIIRTAKAAGNKWLLGQLESFKKDYKTESDYQVWQEGFHPEMITNEEMLIQKMEYIHNNPVKRGLIERSERWIYSSASNYLADRGCMEIDRVDV
jgi:putative transposase